MILPSAGCTNASIPTPAALAANAYMLSRESKSEREKDFLG
jgi:hypothetical protein